MKQTLSRFEPYGELKPNRRQVLDEEIRDLAKFVTTTNGTIAGDRLPQSEILCTVPRASCALIGQSVTTYLNQPDTISESGVNRDV
jgi:hypothetical protein